MAVLAGNQAEISADEESYVFVVGGEDLGPRRMYWNFVHTDSARIEKAAEDWRSGKFDAVPGDDEFIPLPD
jgi:redox-sensitive bicupin YhaK (pirin superfamily)